MAVPTASVREAKPKHTLSAHQPGSRLPPLGGTGGRQVNDGSTSQDKQMDRLTRRQSMNLTALDALGLYGC